MTLVTDINNVDTERDAVELPDIFACPARGWLKEAKRAQR